MTHRILLALLATLAAPAHAACTTSDVTAKVVRAKWVNGCTTTPCPTLKGTALVNIRCDEPTGVQLRLVATDKDGQPVSVVERWPFSVRNAPPGEHPVSLDLWMDHDPDIVGFSLDVVQVKRWADK